MKLSYSQAINRIAEAQGVWVCHGDEPLLQQNILYAFRHHWQQQGIERQRVDVQNIADWKNVFAELDSLSLFATQLAVEVHTAIKPDAAALKQLTAFLAHPQDNFLLIVLPKQDNQSLKSQFFQTISANGTLVTLAANTPAEQRSVLEYEAKNIGVQLTADAWKWLLFHHENNLLAARNTLLLVADSGLKIPATIDVPQLVECVQDQSRYTTFDLSDACLQGDLVLAIKILQFLLQAGEPAPLIFWVLQKEMRLLLQLFEQPNNAEKLGIWSSRIRAYQEALRRISPQQLLRWSELLLRTDSAIKGVGLANADDLLLQVVCALCGRPIFTEAM